MDNPSGRHIFSSKQLIWFYISKDPQMESPPCVISRSAV